MNYVPANFHPLDVLYRYRDPQLHVGEKYCFWEQTLANVDV